MKKHSKFSCRAPGTTMNESYETFTAGQAHADYSRMGLSCYEPVPDHIKKTIRKILIVFFIRS